jgi:hypothetical protein
MHIAQASEIDEMGGRARQKEASGIEHEELISKCEIMIEFLSTTGY